MVRKAEEAMAIITAGKNNKITRLTAGQSGKTALFFSDLLVHTCKKAYDNYESDNSKGTHLRYGNKF